MDLAEAFAKSATDRDLADRFLEDPERVLAGMQVDTSKLRVQAAVAGQPRVDAVKELRQPGPGAEPQPLSVNVCVSIGAVIVVTVGADIDTDDIRRLAKRPLDAAEEAANEQT